MATVDDAPGFRLTTADGELHDEGPKREPWHTPVIKVLPVAESENGVNSVTDSNNTFS